MNTHHLVIVFRTRLRPEVAGDPDLARELELLGESMYEIATGMPGFISYKDFAAADSEYVSIVEFDNAENLAAWRRHPEHLVAQRQGKEKFFEWYQIQVCRVERQYASPSPEL